MITEPTTPTGHSFVVLETDGPQDRRQDRYIKAILAIEAEAREQERERIRAIVIMELGIAKWDELIAPRLGYAIRKGSTDD